MEEENKNPASEKEGNPEEQNPSAESGKQTTEESSAEGGSKSTETNPETKTAEEQSKEENAKFAKMRHEKEVAKAKAAGDAEGYKRARIKSVGGKNPYAGDTPIETDEDFELYEVQDEIKLKGGDPSNVLEVQKALREKAAEKAKAIEDAKTEEEKNQDRANKEVEEYLKAGHTQKELQGYWNDPNFQEFANDLLGNVPLSKIIAKFDKAYPKNPNGKKEAAKNISNPGSASNEEGQAPEKKMSEMSKEEFAKYFEAVKSGKKHL